MDSLAGPSRRQNEQLWDEGRGGGDVGAESLQWRDAGRAERGTAVMFSQGGGQYGVDASMPDGSVPSSQWQQREAADSESERDTSLPPGGGGDGFERWGTNERRQRDRENW